MNIIPFSGLLIATGHFFRILHNYFNYVLFFPSLSLSQSPSLPPSSNMIPFPDMLKGLT